MSYDAFISYSHAADNQLAPALQQALHQLGKPWYKRRALDIFRDQTNLHVTPHLWPSIEKALLASEHFILLASPESARSKWVQKEIDFWLANKSVDTLLIVLTDGVIAWDEKANDFDWQETDALPSTLQKQLPYEPKYVDLSDAKRSEDLALSNPAFKSPTVELAATLHRLSVNNFIGEEVRQHKKTIRIRNGAVVALATLAISAILLAWRATANEQLARKNLSQSLSILSEVNVEEDPTLSFRLAEMAYRNDPGNLNAQCKLIDAAQYHHYDKLPGQIKGFSYDHNKLAYYQAEAQQLQVLDLNKRSTVSFPVSLSQRQTALFLADQRFLCLINTTNGTDPVLLFDLPSRKQLPLEGNPSGNRAFVSPDGSRIALADWREQQPLRLWDLNTGDSIHLKGHTQSYSLGIFSGDSRYFIAGSNYGEAPLRIWNTSTGDTLAIPENTPYGADRSSYYENFSMSPDGKHLASIQSTGEENVLRVYRLGESPEIIYETTIDLASYLLFSPDGQRISCYDGYNGSPMRLFSLYPPEEIPLDDTTDYFTVKYSGDGSRLLSMPKEGSALVLWNTQTGQKIQLQGQNTDYEHALFSSSGKKMMAISKQGGVQIWNTVNGEQAYVYDGADKFASGAFSADDKQAILFSQTSSKMLLVDLHRSRTVPLYGSDAGIDYVFFAPEGTDVFALNFSTSVAKKWNIKNAFKWTAPSQYKFTGGQVDKIGTNVLLEWQEGEGLSCWDLDDNQTLFLDKSDLEPAFDDYDFAPNGNRLLAKRTFGGMAVWNLENGEQYQLPGTDFTFKEVQFGPAGNNVSAVRLYTLPSLLVFDLLQEDTLTLEGNQHEYSHALFSPSGSHLLAFESGGNSPVGLWELEAKRQVHLNGNNFNYGQAAFSKDGAKVVMSNGSSYEMAKKHIKLWDLQTLDSIPLEKNTIGLDHALFSADDRYLLAYNTSDSACLRLWDMRTNQLVLDIDSLYALADVYFSEDGHKLAAHERDGLLLVWELANQKPELLLHTDVSAFDITEFTEAGDAVMGLNILGEVNFTFWELASGKMVKLDEVIAGCADYFQISPALFCLIDRQYRMHLYDFSNGSRINMHALAEISFADYTYLKSQRQIVGLTSEGQLLRIPLAAETILSTVNAKQQTWNLDELTREKYGVTTNR